MKSYTKYIITAKTDNEDLRYLALDHDLGYFYWVSYFNRSIFLKSVEDAEQILRSKDFTKSEVMGDTIYPPRLIHIGSNLWNKKLQGEVEITIMGVACIPVQSSSYKCNITKIK